MQSNHITKRLTAGLLSLVMLLTLLPTAVFAEEVTEDAPLCVCETACTAESLNADCPVCGAEGAAETDCGLYTAPDPEPTDPELEAEFESTAETESGLSEEAAAVQAMFDALPDAEAVADMTAEERAEVSAQADAAYAAFEALTDPEDMTAIDLTRFAALMDALTAAAETQAVVTETVGNIVYYCPDINADEPEAWARRLSEEAWNNDKLTELTIPDTVTLGGREDIPVTRVMNYFLLNTKSIATAVTTLTLGKNVREIYSNAAYISNLKTLVIPKDSQLEIIGRYAFSDCEEFESISVEGTGGNKLPASLTDIGDYAFYGCKKLTSIDLSDTNVTYIRQGAFIGSGLKSITLPENSESLGLGDAAFSGTGLTSITLPEQLSYMGILTFSECKSLKTITFKGTFLEAQRTTMRGSFEALDPDCTIITPQPNSAETYNAVMENVYANWSGSAGAKTKVRWSETGSGQTAPTGVQVTNDSLTALENLAKDAENGITVDRDKDGFAAVITISEGSGVPASLTATASGGTPYWSTVNSAAQRTGESMADAVKRYALRSGSGESSTIALDTSGEAGKIVYYVPVATNYGDISNPETSTVGQPVMVRYIPTRVTPSVSYSNAGVYYGMDLPNAAESPEAAGADHPRYNYKGMRARLSVPGFDAALGGTLRENETIACNSDKSAYIQYEWYRADTKGTGNGTKINGATGYAVYSGAGQSPWRIGRPIDTQLTNALQWGPNFLYAKITVRMNNTQTVIYTAFSEFYRYDSDFKVKVSVGPSTGIISTDFKFIGSSNTSYWAETNTYQNADRVLTISGVYEDGEDGISGDKLTGYRKLMGYCVGCDVEVAPWRYGNSQFYSSTTRGRYDFSASGTSFAAPTEMLGATYQNDNATPATAAAIQLTLKPKFSFGGTCGTEYPGYVFQWVNWDGNTPNATYDNSYFSDDLTQWASEMVGGKHFTNWNECDIPLYSVGTGNSFKGNGWYAVLYRVENADQNRGGTPVLFVCCDEDAEDFAVPEKYADLPVIEGAVNGMNDGKPSIGLWSDDDLAEILDAEPGVNYFYWKAESGNRVDYSPVIARFKSDESLSTTVSVTTRKDTAYKAPGADITDDAVIPVRFNGTNIGVEDLVSDGLDAPKYLYMYTRDGTSGAWGSQIQVKNNRASGESGIYLEISSISTTSTSSNGVLFTQTDAKICVTEKAFTNYDTNKDGEFQVYFEWNGGSTGTFKNVSARSGIVTVKRTDNKLTLTTEAKIGGASQGDTITRKVEYQVDEDGNVLKDQDGNHLTTGNPLEISAKAEYAAGIGSAEDIVWNVRMRGSSSFDGTLSVDGSITLGNTNVTVDVSRAQITGQLTWTQNSDLTITAPSDSKSYTITLAPTAKVVDASGKTVAEASAPPYTVVINPVQEAQAPTVGTHPQSRNYLPGTDLTGATPLTAQARVSDGGSLTWQWYRCTGSNGAGATLVEGAFGSGEKAEFKLPTEITSQIATYYYFCRFTNTNPNITGSSAQTIATRDSAVCKISISEDLVTISAPTVISGEDGAEFLYQWGLPEQLLPEALSITVSQPEKITNALPSYVPFNQPTQVAKVSCYLWKREDNGNLTEAWMKSYSGDYALEDGERTNQFGDSYASDYTSRPIIMEVKNGFNTYSIASGKLTSETLWGEGGSFYDIRNDEDAIFELRWTVTNTLPKTDGAAYSYPTNLNGEPSASTTYSVFITRQTIEKPTLVAYEDGAYFQFENGTTTSTITGTADGKSLTNIPCVELAQGGSEAYREVSFTTAPIDDSATSLVAGLDYWNGTAWEPVSGEIKDLTPERNKECTFQLQANSTRAEDTITYYRLTLRGQRSSTSTGITSGETSEPYYFAVKTVAKKDVTTPTAPTDNPANFEDKYWYYKKDAGDVGEETTELRLQTGPWLINDKVVEDKEGKLTYRWIYYDDTTGKYVPLAAKATGRIFTLTGESQFVKDGIAAAKEANDGEKTDWIRLEVTNSDPTATGSREKTEYKDIRVIFTTAPAIPKVKITASTSPDETSGDVIISRNDSLSMTATIENAASMQTKAYGWRYDLIAIKPTEGEVIDAAGKYNCEWILKSDWKSETAELYPASYMYYCLKGESNPTYLNDDFWATHESVTFRFWCVVTNTDDSKGKTDTQGTSNFLDVTITNAVREVVPQPPTASPASGATFSENLNVKLTTESGGDNISIWYTTDGSDPTSSTNEKAMRYTSAGIVLTSTTTIKAATRRQTAKDDYLWSEVATFTYTKVSGVSVSGKVKSYNPKNATTITLTSTTDATKVYTATIAAQTEGSGQVTQDFKIEGVVVGKYDLVVTKAGHLKYTIKGIVVDEANLDLSKHTDTKISTITLIAGNMNTDKAINNSDMMLFRAQFGKKGNAITNKSADINGDNRVNNSDMLLFRSSFGKTEQSCTYDYE